MAESNTAFDGAIKIAKESWQVLSSKFNQLWLLALVAFIPSALNALFGEDQLAGSNVQDNLQARLDSGDPAAFTDYLESALGVSLGEFGVIVLVLLIVSFCYTVFAQGANISNALRVMKNTSADVTTNTIISGGTSNFGRLAVAFIVVGLIVMVGLVLLIVPGLIAVFLLGFTFHLIVDKGLALGDAMRSSYELVKNNIGKIAALGVVVLIVGIAVSLVSGVIIAILPGRIDALVAAAFNAVFGIFGLLAGTRLYLNLVGTHHPAKVGKVISE